MGFFLRFQGSKGDLGMTGPTGAAGLPVSVMRLGLSVPHPYPTPTPPTEALSANIQSQGRM